MFERLPRYASRMNRFGLGAAWLTGGRVRFGCWEPIFIMVTRIPVSLIPGQLPAPLVDPLLEQDAYLANDLLVGIGIVDVPDRPLIRVIGSPCQMGGMQMYPIKESRQDLRFPGIVRLVALERLSIERFATEIVCSDLVCDLVPATPRARISHLRELLVALVLASQTELECLCIGVGDGGKAQELQQTAHCDALRFRSIGFEHLLNAMPQMRPKPKINALVAQNFLRSRRVSAVMTLAVGANTAICWHKLVVVHVCALRCRDHFLSHLPTMYIWFPYKTP